MKEEPKSDHCDMCGGDQKGCTTIYEAWAGPLYPYFVCMDCAYRANSKLDSIRLDNGLNSQKFKLVKKILKHRKGHKGTTNARDNNIVNECHNIALRWHFMKAKPAMMRFLKKESEPKPPTLWEKFLAMIQ